MAKFPYCTIFLLGEISVKDVRQLGRGNILGCAYKEIVSVWSVCPLVQPFFQALVSWLTASEGGQRIAQNASAKNQ